jgi:hypothetical protein
MIGEEFEDTKGYSESVYRRRIFILYLLQGSYLYRMDDVAEMKY